MSTQDSQQARTFVVTGAASGIGRATRERLRAAGHQVIGIDLAGADIVADLSSGADRSTLAERVEAAGVTQVDGVLAIAGVSNHSATPVRVNYFGAIATLEQLRPLMNRSSTPRAVIVASFAAIQACDDVLLARLREGDEDGAVERAHELVHSGSGDLIYSSTKRAIAEWVRVSAIHPDWAGAGIPINAVAPGVIVTPMTREILSSGEGRASVMQMVPMPLNGPAEPSAVASLLDWLTSGENTHVTGQAIFIDGGAEASVRGPRIFK